MSLLDIYRRCKKEASAYVLNESKRVQPNYLDLLDAVNRAGAQITWAKGLNLPFNTLFDSGLAHFTYDQAVNLQVQRANEQSRPKRPEDYERVFSCQEDWDNAEKEMGAIMNRKRLNYNPAFLKEFMESNRPKIIADGYNALIILMRFMWDHKEMFPFSQGPICEHLELRDYEHWFSIMSSLSLCEKYMIQNPSQFEFSAYVRSVEQQVANLPPNILDAIYARLTSTGFTEHRDIVSEFDKITLTPEEIAEIPDKTDRKNRYSRIFMEVWDRIDPEQGLMYEMISKEFRKFEKELQKNSKARL